AGQVSPKQRAGRRRDPRRCIPTRPLTGPRPSLVPVPTSQASSVACCGGGVKIGAPVGCLPDKAAHRLSGDEAERRSDLADRPGPFLTVELELVGDTATREQIEAGAGEADPGPDLADPPIAPRPGLIGGYPGDLGAPELAGAFQHDLDGVHADPVGVEREPGPAVADEHVADGPAGGQQLDTGQLAGRRHGLGHQDHELGARVAAVLAEGLAGPGQLGGDRLGTAGQQHKGQGQQRKAPHSSPADLRVENTISRESTPPSRTPSSRPTRRKLQRWVEIGWGRSGSSLRNSLCRSRPCSRIHCRSWDGMVMPWVAAKASAISSLPHCNRARSYTCCGLVRVARTSSMLARSTAWRHGLGLTSAKNTSIRWTRPSRTSRLAGLMSRWARPAAHSRRMIRSPSSMMAWSTSTSASPSSLASSKNSKVIRYSRSGVISTIPNGSGLRTPAPKTSRRAGSSCWTSRRTVLNGFSSSSRPYSRVRPSLYQRSARRWLPAYSLANSQVSGSPLTVTRRGVEPADPDSPNGLISATWMPSGSSRAWWMAWPRRPPTSRWAELPRW